MFPDNKEIIPSLLCSDKPLDEPKARMYSPLTLAFLGDAVYSIMVRETLTLNENKPAGKLHRESVDYVNAAFQAKMIKEMLPFLTDAEIAVFKRGRNAHSAHSPKNQSESDYRYATGFEALFGYLYLCGKFERLRYLFEKCAATHRESTDCGSKPADQ